MLRKGYGGLYKAPKKEEEESERLRGERDQIKFIDLGLESWQVVGLSHVGESSWWPIQSPSKGREKILLIDLRFERWQVVGLRKARRQDVP